MRRVRTTSTVLGLVLALSSAAVSSSSHTFARATSSGTNVGHSDRGADPRPNIFMITVDDAAPGDLKYLPHVRHLIADHGVRMTNAVAPTPICVPARASLLTGQYAHNHGAETIYGRNGGFHSFEDRSTLPVWLRHAGYDTLFVGKYLNGYGKHGSQTYVPPGWREWHGSVDPYTYRYESPVLNVNGVTERSRTYSTDLFARHVDGLLERKRRTRVPWYLWVNYVAPHNGGPLESDDPLRRDPHAKVHLGTPKPADRHRNLFAGLPLPEKPNMFERNVKDKQVPKAATHWGPKLRHLAREAYQQRLESLQAVDEAVARHVRVLRRTGQLDDTLIVLASDNGYQVGEHNMYGKFYFYRDASQIPMVMRGPGVPRGRSVTTIVTNVDLPVTFAAVAGATPGREVDGVDVRPFLRGPVMERAVPLEGYPVHGGTRPVYTGVRIGEHWNYARLRHHHEELYDLHRDPYELHNVADDPAYAEELRRVRRLDRALRDCRGDSCHDGGTQG